MVNARMAFDRESLLPLYRLEIGAAGESCALYIAERLGMPPYMLDCARRASQGKTPGARQEEGAILAVRALEEEKEAEEKPLPHGQRFQPGDGVVVYPRREQGIVFARMNGKGEIGVQIKGRKLFVNHKRVKLHLAAAELYPEDYDLSVVLDSVENRKARHKMDKRHEAGNTVVLREGREL